MNVEMWKMELGLDHGNLARRRKEDPGGRGEEEI
jgi:hypothetical protein